MSVVPSEHSIQESPKHRKSNLDNFMFSEALESQDAHFIFLTLCFIAKRIYELHEKIITRKKIISVCRSLKGITYSCKRKYKNQ